jgi:RNA polymerase sigma factor (sigma-70 family)
MAIAADLEPMDQGASDDEAFGSSHEDGSRVFARNQHAETLFIAYHSWLKRALRRRVGDISDAEDIASETFTQIISAPALGSVAEPRAFLMTIANRILYKLWRRRDLDHVCAETLLALHGPDVYYSPEDQRLLVEAVEIIDKVLGALTLREREIFLAYRLDGATYDEIAATHALSQSAVRRVVAKGLRQCLVALAA